MKNIVIRIAVCCLVIMTGCSKTVMSTDALSGIPRKIETIPVESALATLDNRIDELYGSFTRTTTKSYDISDVMSVDGEDLLGPSTKSSGVDIDGPLVYIVNFEGENGFAVISANTLFEEKIFCITEKGSMKTMGISPPAHVADSTTAPRWYQQADPEDRTMSDAEADEDTLYIKSAVSDEDDIPDVISDMIVYRLLDEIDIFDPTMQILPVQEVVDEPDTGPIQSIYGPYLMTKWHQESPFNDLLNENDDEKENNNIAAGCVAIATGQIMVYNRHSNTMIFNGMACSWDALESVCRWDDLDGGVEAAKAQAANFIYELGKKENINTDYGQSSGAYPKNARRTLKNYGYSNVKLHCGFGKCNQEKAIDQLVAGRPVFLGGNMGSIGHAWVLDGFYNGYHVGQDGEEHFRMFHVNWGWHGAGDGYYDCGIFDTSQKADEDDIDDNAGYPGYYNFTRQFRMITYD